MSKHTPLEPPGRTWGDNPSVDGVKVPEGFTLKSNTVPQMSVEEMRELIGEAV